MLITGLNMLPVSQLDGGHTIYGLFGRDAYKIARAFIIVAIAYMILYLEQAAIWTPMLILVILLGIHHPPTADDNVELDDFRWILGVASRWRFQCFAFPLARAEAVMCCRNKQLSTTAQVTIAQRSEITLHLIRETGKICRTIDQAWRVCGEDF
jgi:hypothetical protein